MYVYDIVFNGYCVVMQFPPINRNGNEKLSKCEKFMLFQYEVAKACGWIRDESSLRRAAASSQTNGFEIQLQRGDPGSGAGSAVGSGAASNHTSTYPSSRNTSHNTSLEVASAASDQIYQLMSVLILVILLILQI